MSLTTQSELWQRVFLVFDAGTACEECPFHHEWREPQPGIGPAESLRSCALIGGSRWPEKCPGIDETSNPNEEGE